MKDHDIKAPALADQGERRIEWAWQEMPVLRELMQRFDGSKPLAGVPLSGCLHITTETANLARTLTGKQARYLSSWREATE